MISSIWDKEPMSSDKCVQHLSNLSQMGLIPFAPSTFQKVGAICDVTKGADTRLAPLPGQ